MENDFDLIINDVTYRVKTPARERITRVNAFNYAHRLPGNEQCPFQTGRARAFVRREEPRLAAVRGAARRRAPDEEGTPSIEPARRLAV